MGRSRSHNGFNNLSTHTTFVPCQSGLPFLGYGYFPIWPWKSKAKIVVQCHITWVQHPINSRPFCCISIDPPMFEKQLFQNLTLKIQCQGHGYVKIHKVGPTSHQLTSLSFHVNQPIHSRDRAFSKSDLGNPRSYNGTNILSTHIPFIPFQSTIPFMMQLFHNLTFKIEGQGQGWDHSSKSQSHKLPIDSQHPFHPSHSWDTTFSKFDLKNPR